MSQILRHHEGQAHLPTNLLTDLEHLLDMDLAKPPTEVEPLAKALRDPARDINLDLERNEPEIVHEWLWVLTVDAMQQLRRSHDENVGTVEALHLSEVRNALDTLGYTWGVECEEWAETDLGDREDLHVVAEKYFAAGNACWRCPTCQFVVARDRIDQLLDRLGFVGPAYYDGVDYDAEQQWQDWVTPQSTPLIPTLEALARESA